MSKISRSPRKKRPEYGVQYGLSDLSESFDIEPTRSVRFENTQNSQSKPTPVRLTRSQCQSRGIRSKRSMSQERFKRSDNSPTRY